MSSHNSGNQIILKKSLTDREQMVFEYFRDNIGKTVYAVVQYSKIGKYEVVKGTVTRKTIKSRNTFTVSGKYSNGNYYTGVFSEKAIGKSVFFNEEEANEESCKLNSKKHS